MRRSRHMEITTEVLADGSVKVVITGALPQPTIAENARWKWTPWNAAYQAGQLQKDGARVLTSLANLKLVESTVASRKAAREEEKAAKAPQALVAAAAQSPAPAQTVVVADVPAAAPAPTPAAKSPAKRKGKRS
jgi:hypothetical protein